MATLNLGRVQPIDRGTYNALTAYKKLDFISNEDNTSYYTCILDAPVGTPLSNVTYFREAIVSPSSAAGTTYDNSTSGLSATTVQNAVDELSSNKDSDVPSSPVFLEQFISGFYGRGMLATETPSIAVNRTITAASSAGTNQITVLDTSGFQVGGGCVVKHTNGKYESYFITALTGTTISTIPSLKYDVNINDGVERTWYDPAHPGKFYMRHLAQRIAGASNLSDELPFRKRVYFSQLDGTSDDQENILNAVGSASISYLVEDNAGGGGSLSLPTERNIGFTAYVTPTSSGDGAETAFFDISQVVDLKVRFALQCRDATNTITVTAVYENGDTITPATLFPIAELTGDGLTSPKIYNFPLTVRGDSQRVKLRFTTDVVGSTADIIIDQLEVFESNGLTGNVFQDQSATIVCVGDSWVAGDLSGSLEREPITQQLEIELPKCNVVNAGVGGNTIANILTRFDTDVTPFNPDYVVVNTGTNDSYNPASGTFEPNATDYFNRAYNQLINKIIAIGARPIIIGVPALAEEDGVFTTFQLNDRAKTYSRLFYKNITDKSDWIYGDDTSGYIKRSDGTLESWKQVTVDMTIGTAQVFALDMPSSLNFKGFWSATATLESEAGGNTLSGWSGHSVKAPRDSKSITVQINSFPGSLTTETVVVRGVGRWR